MAVLPYRREVGADYKLTVSNDVLLALVVITALAFDFTNGFHDTGNAMATSIATGALPPGRRRALRAC